MERACIPHYSCIPCIRSARSGFACSSPTQHASNSICHAKLKTADDVTLVKVFRLVMNGRVDVRAEMSGRSNASHRVGLNLHPQLTRQWICLGRCEGLHQRAPSTCRLGQPASHGLRTLPLCPVSIPSGTSTVREDRGTPSVGGTVSFCWLLDSATTADAQFAIGIHSHPAAVALSIPPPP